MSTHTILSRGQLGRLVVVLLIAVVGTLVVGNVLGRPLLLSFVETGSMEPTIATGDGFVALPPALTGGVEVGDVIVFDATELNGGGLTTHRVVGETSGGYVTRGDANTVTDQDSGEPPVSDARIVAVAWRPHGTVLTVPHLGTASLRLQAAMKSVRGGVLPALGVGSLSGSGFRLVMFLGGVVLLVASVGHTPGSESNRDRSRSRARSETVDPRVVFLAVGLLVCAVALGTMVWMSDTTELGVISAEYDSERPDVISAGTTSQQTFTHRNGGLLPVVSVLESSSELISVETMSTTLPYRGSETVRVRITAPSDPGYYRLPLADYRYLAVLPPAVIVGLHAIHPWLAMAAVATVTSGVVLAPLGVLLGVRTRRLRSRTRSQRSEEWF